jgi:hypothetical protein
VIAALANDFSYAWRTLHKTPGFAIATVLLLSIGIGGTTLVFSAVDAILPAKALVVSPLTAAFAVLGDGGLHHALDAVAAQAAVVADAFDFEQSPVDLPADFRVLKAAPQCFHKIQYLKSCCAKPPQKGIVRSSLTSKNQ